MQKQGRVRDSFNLRRDISVRAERLAKRTGTSRSAIYRAAVEEYLERHEQAAVTAAINAALSGQPQDLDFVEAAQRTLATSGLIDEWNE